MSRPQDPSDRRPAQDLTDTVDISATPPPLSPAAQALAAELAEAPDPAALARVWERVESTPVTDDRAAPAARAGLRRYGLAAAVSVAAAAVLVGVVRGAESLGRRTDSEEASTALHSESEQASGGRAARRHHDEVHRAQSPEANAPALPPSEEDAPAATSSAPAPERDPKPTPAPRTGPSAQQTADEAAAAGRPDPLAEEAELLRRATTALDRGDYTQALQWTRQHGTAFAEGALARERETLRVLALCGAGRLREGRGYARRWLATHAGGPTADRIRQQCRLPAVVEKKSTSDTIATPSGQSPQ